MALLLSKPMINPTVIGEVKCSQVMYDTIRERGGTAIMYKTGHSNLKVKIRETNADLAAEVSGHIFFNDHFYGYDDALYVGLRLLNLLGEEDMTLDQLYDALPTAINTPELRFDCPDDEKFEAINRIQAQLKGKGADFPDVDGVRVNVAGGWWLLRASNTQAVLVARCEAPSEQALETVKKDMRLNLEEAGIHMPAI